MSRWKTALLLVALGLGGLLAGLLAASVALGPATLLNLPGGQWLMEQLQTSQRGTLERDGQTVPVLRRGDPVPALSLLALDGTPLTLPLGERPILINFWASWCAPCIHEMPLLERFAQAHPELLLVGVALDEPGAVSQFLARHPVQFTIAIEAAGPADHSRQFGNRLGVLPYSVLIDADGILRKLRAGAFKQEELDRWAP